MAFNFKGFKIQASDTDLYRKKEIYLRELKKIIEENTSIVFTEVFEKEENKGVYAETRPIIVFWGEHPSYPGFKIVLHNYAQSDDYRNNMIDKESFIKNYITTNTNPSASGMCEAFFGCTRNYPNDTKKMFASLITLMNENSSSGSADIIRYVSIANSHKTCFMEIQETNISALPALMLYAPATHGETQTFATHRQSGLQTVNIYLSEQDIMPYWNGTTAIGAASGGALAVSYTSASQYLQSNSDFKFLHESVNDNRLFIYRGLYEHGANSGGYIHKTVRFGHRIRAIKNITGTPMDGITTGIVNINGEHYYLSHIIDESSTYQYKVYVLIKFED